MPVPPKLVRRLVIAPLVALVEIALAVLTPLLLLLAVLASPVAGGLRPVRFVMIVISFAVHHLLAMLACLALWPARGNQRAHYAVMRWFVDGVYRTIVKLAHVTVHYDEDPETRAVLEARDRPVLVLGRHAGEGDTILVIRDLLVRYGRGPRVVLHEKLRLDPLIDVLGDRLPNRFVDPRGGDIERDIAAMAAELPPQGALVIFPEGVNFSERARQKSIDRLERAGRTRQATAARAMRHVSAPRPGGALAAVEATPDLAVVVMGHAGFPMGLRETWDLLPHHQPVEIGIWGIEPPPAAAEPDDRIHWLFEAWADLDAWIQRRA